MVKVLVGLLCGLALVVVGCTSEPPNATPDIQATIDALVTEALAEQPPVPPFDSPSPPTPFLFTGQLDLSRQDASVSSMPLDQGTHYSVTIQIQQEEDSDAQCGNPQMVDASGNVIATLTPIDPTPTGAEYRYSGTAESDGLYKVAFDNTECNVRQSGGVAFIEWRITGT